ncbi:MinD/ParA family ATP-binding protein [Micromonospora profundi]|uniref:MinD/ParA family ATP-binding protein n=1 Tax=Micromonospora profundi TaxID=1420889 RepID=UPI0036A9F382
MDKNADRAQVPGQQPVPERDIEPLWPPDPAGRGADVVPPWAAVAEKRGEPAPTPPAAVTPPVAAPPIGRPPVPGQPGATPLPPPSPSDYPSLSGAVPPPTGWGAAGPSGAGSGWAPAQPSWPPAEPTVPPVSSTPSSGSPTNADTPTGPAATHVGPPNGVTVSPTEAAGTGTPGASDAAGTSTPNATHAAGTAFGAPQPGGRGSASVPATPVTPGGVDLDQPFSLDRPPVTPTVTPEATTGPAVAGPTTPTTGEPADGPVADGKPAPQAGSGNGSDVGGNGTAVGTARPATESPWAYPPQRPANSTPSAHDEATTAIPPIPAPPVPQTPQAGGPAAGAGQTYAGQAYSGQAYPIPGQVGPAPVPPPPDPQQAGAAAAPPGPFPPSPGWYPPPWQQGTAAAPPPPQSYQETDPVARVPAAGYQDATWTPETTAAPTAEDFARRRQVRPADPVATMGVRAVVNKIGLVRLSPGRHEQELKRDIEMVRRNFGGLRQVTVVNPKGGAGKTVAILLLAMTFGQKRGGYVLAWDNNETQGTLGMRAQQDFHSRTVRDMLRDLGQFQGAHGRVGDLSQYVRSQGEGMFDVLASDESATGGEMLTAAAFAEIREVVSRFYKLIFVDTGNNVRAQNWQASMDATDQLVVTMSARNDSAETAARMLDHLEQSGRQRLVRQAVTVVSMPPSRKEIDLPAIQEHFAARTRAVLLAPYERLIDSGEPIRYGGLSSATRDAWLKIAAAVAEGL